MESTSKALNEAQDDNLNYKACGNERYDEILEHMTRCCLCGSELSFHHETDYIMLTVREEAHCNSCGIRNKKEAHTIQ